MDELSEWKMYNFVTGKYEMPPEDIPSEGPSRWWVEGWECYMHNGLSENPYEPATTEYWEWQDGYYAAETD